MFSTLNAYCHGQANSVVRLEHTTMSTDPDPELEALRARRAQELAAQAESSANAPTAPVVVSDGDLASTVKAHPLVLVDVWAPWCGPCRHLEPIIKELARDMAGRVVFAKLNSDENPRTTQAFQVQAIPTMLIFRDGKLVEQLIGVHPKGDIVARLERFGA